ncbi:hypothetical protein BDK51DRAFT_47023 [Blyttiomyces helicus]|uniref:Protein kinase domain-containing protein n=1 Tax=Blyttiomyces helicus TaxID=388810 RepID=A0A4P9W6N1_9FUNG|nr:hypothetical protein BDK51DRAFT_47023 [Blyttiomyces helicus]|eukprot:RKO87662.1 hypothetical protein BDK51DRAFT_47023 [Blyttiomyces helicus]
MEQLFPVSKCDIKGYPCMIYNKLTDPIKFGVKIIPLDLQFELDSHPCRIESALLNESTNLVKNRITPHITFYFSEMNVFNRKKSMTRFPLKSLRYDIHRESKVLIAEYVPGGSIEEWIREQPNISEKQWKYIIFSIAWTLLVLHDRYEFIHNDFHYGNVLIDTSVDPKDRSNLQYRLNTEEGKEPIIFDIPNVGIMPKIWDLEFASTFKEKSDSEGKSDALRNEFFRENEENIPHNFNPYYDLHCFLTSLLDLDIPDSLVKFILKLYPEELLPPIQDDSFSRSKSAVSGSSMSSRSNQSGLYTESTRRRDSSSQKTGDSSSSYHTSDFYKTDEESSKKSSRTYSSASYSGSSYGESVHSDGSQIRTEFMLGDRMLNGSEKKFKLPTPLDILNDDYFLEYRQQTENDKKPNAKYPGGKNNVKNKKLVRDSVVFSYTLEIPRFERQEKQVTENHGSQKIIKNKKKPKDVEWKTNQSNEVQSDHENQSQKAKENNQQKRVCKDEQNQDDMKRQRTKKNENNNSTINSKNEENGNPIYPKKRKPTPVPSKRRKDTPIPYKTQLK